MKIVKKLATKYFSNTINELELKELSKLLKNSKNQNVFKKYVKDYYDLNLSLQNINLEADYNTIIRNIQQYKKPSRPFYRSWSRVAALFIVLLGLGYFMNLIINKETTIIDENAITITLDNGDVKVINEDGSEHILNKEGRIVGTQEGTEIDYRIDSLKVSNANAKTEELVYNELSIPYGKKLKLTLSDGTLVHLNAGTTMKYPVKFLKNKERKVFINGEAYFEVTEDKNHPFIVNTSEMNIKVLGTKFNVSAYNDDNSINTVLVKGAVGLYEEDEDYNTEAQVVLSPNQKAFWSKTDKLLEIGKVDVTEYIAWTEGKLLFKIRPFSEIIKVLERHYDVSITNNYNYLNSAKFFATFDTETIDQVLIAFQNSETFTFQRNGNNIIINP